MKVIVPAAEASCRKVNSPGMEDLLYPGYALAEREARPDGLHLTLRPARMAVCPRCGAPCGKIHETRMRVVRDAPVPGEGHVFVHVPVRRVRCRCGCRRTELIPWLAGRERMTYRMIALVQRRLRSDISTLAVCRELGIGWDVARRLDREQLEPLFGEVIPKRMTRMVIDEIAVHKGQRYVTILMDYDTRQVFDVVEGKSVKSLRPAFERLRAAGIAEQVVAVGCDMNAAYPQLVREYMPNADVVYDLFHVVKLLSDGVLKEARQKQAEAAEKKYGRHSSEARSQRRLLRSGGYLLVAQPELLKPSARERLKELLENNELMAKLHPLVEQVKCIWRAWSPEEAAGWLADTAEDFMALADEHGLRKAASFARTLLSRSDGIVKAGMHRISTGPLEGVNTRAKLLKRIAYGYRSIKHFMLKLKAAFPGRGVNPLHALTDWSCLIGGDLWEARLCHESRRRFSS